MHSVRRGVEIVLTVLIIVLPPLGTIIGLLLERAILRRFLTRARPAVDFEGDVLRSCEWSYVCRRDRWVVPVLRWCQVKGGWLGGGIKNSQEHAR